MGNIADFYKSSAVSSPYGEDRGDGRTHRGVDFSHSRTAGTIGVPAARAGVVVGKRRPSGDHGFGNGIIIRSVLDDGREWDISYNHGHYFPDQPIGARIAAGEIVLHEGRTGWTDGSCVHIEQQLVGGGFTNPLEEMLRCAARDAGAITPPPVTPPVESGGFNPFGIPFSAGLQKIARLYGYAGELDQKFGGGSMAGFAQFLRANWGYSGNDTLGPVMWASIARWLRARYGYEGNDVPGPVMRAALSAADTKNWNEL